MDNPDKIKQMSLLNKYLPFEAWIACRYIKFKQKNSFISFISMTSMVGIALGVSTLIIILSVMNGFQDELRTRILGVASHIEITSSNNVLNHWEDLTKKLHESPDVKGSAPYVDGQGMLVSEYGSQGIMLRGIASELEGNVDDLEKKVKVGRLSDLKPNTFNMILGIDVAKQLGIVVGDKVNILIPQGSYTPAGTFPRMRQFNIVGIFEIGMYEYDSGMALMNLEDAQKFLQMNDAVSGVRVKIDDLFLAPIVAKRLSNNLSESGVFYVNDWTKKHANFFAAVQMEKRVMFIILMLIIAVAAFNIVSTLVMAVTDKRSDIAILRTYGAKPKSILYIFIIQGSLIGVIGTISGVFLGTVVALNIHAIVPFIEHLFNVQFLSKDIYYISEVPSKLLITDVSAIASISILLSVLATIYPSITASKSSPAEALKHD
ncbi:MAG: lipoprotein-releasing ABC transporter permease subunit [Candidatus Methylopumilus sp.]|jgi:lipoprotein-releasing system permease protein|nr:lipoprotein-releasing ABC transporter permease subunit [Candidatus Methylopumilus sp.]